jgi:hypothetical protein
MLINFPKTKSNSVAEKQDPESPILSTHTLVLFNPLLSLHLLQIKHSETADIQQTKISQREECTGLQEIQNDKYMGMDLW